ncbi:MAG: DUF1800 family protein [Gammaproteobacteria bacterium]|nr:DUF1800 family protein [Gammaproteobacteria bacterium]
MAPAVGQYGQRRRRRQPAPPSFPEGGRHSNRPRSAFHPAGRWHVGRPSRATIAQLSASTACSHCSTSSCSTTQASAWGTTSRAESPRPAPIPMPSSALKAQCRVPLPSSHGQSRSGAPSSARPVQDASGARTSSCTGRAGAGCSIASDRNAMNSHERADIALSPAPSCADADGVAARAGAQRVRRVSPPSFRPRLVVRVAIAALLAVAAIGTQAAVSGEPPALPGLTTVSPARWDATAVRKVMRTFAFGGQASDAQVDLWAAMAPQDAIVQMLTFDEHNLRLSPPDPVLRREAMASRPQTLRALGDYWSSADQSNLMPGRLRRQFTREARYGPMLTWMLAARVRGGNPFRHRVGFWETNFHLAVNHAGSVSNYQVVRYYDDVMAALRRGESYDKVIATAASSAAIAQQYGHRYNRYIDGVCYCNEDFARELHQLGFGVLGTGDRAYHELVSVKNTAKVLTGMRLTSREAPDETQAEIPTYSRVGHIDAPVPILRTMVGGSNMQDDLRELARFEIDYPESSDALPLMIVQGMADDQISPGEAQALRRAWRAMPRKDLLRFLRVYAISTHFHSPQRTRQLSSLDRFMIFANRFTDSNLENYGDVVESWRLHLEEGVIPFEPWHEVFGHQTGPEAAASADLFRKHYARASDAHFAGSKQSMKGHTRYKDWRALMPHATRYEVRATAEWLWQRFIADGLKNFGPLERGHVYALLATGRDLGAVLRPNAANTRVTPEDLASGAGLEWMTRTASRTLALASRSPDARATANDRIGAAVAFIIATPFMLAEEGR